MPCEDKNFCGSLVLDFGIWWRHVKTIYYVITITIICSPMAGHIWHTNIVAFDKSIADEEIAQNCCQPP